MSLSSSERQSTTAGSRQRSKRSTGSPSAAGAASIVADPSADVNASPAGVAAPARRGRAGRKNTRRQSHGSAWHWKQTDAWYYTLPGTKRRVSLVDEEGQRIRGLENKKAAQLALAHVRAPHAVGDTGAALPGLVDLA